jgi:hypothetical protein
MILRRRIIILTHNFGLHSKKRNLTTDFLPDIFAYASK